jgi:fumarylpyruvate hydrolase
MSFVIPAPPPASVEVTGTDDRFPVRRIYCIGRNYLLTLSLPVSTASANSR